MSKTAKSIVATMLLVVCLISIPSFAATSTDADSSQWKDFLVGPDAAIDHPAEEKWIPISTVEDLGKIGKNSKYPLSGKYYLTNNIVFKDGDDLNGGFDLYLHMTKDGDTITLSVTMSGSQRIKVSEGVITFNSEIIPLKNADVQASFNVETGGAFCLSVGGVATNSPINGQSFALSYRGYMGSNGSFTMEFDSNGNMDPIGDCDAHQFTGIFDGNGYTITNLMTAVYSKNNETCFSGFIGLGNQIMNLGLLNYTNSVAGITGTERAGSIAGYATKISNCFSTGSVFMNSNTDGTSYSKVGGIAGEAGSITNCYNSGHIDAWIQSNTGIKSSVGGIAGSSVSVTNSHNVEDVTLVTRTGNLASSGNIGGVAGISNTVSKCYNLGDVNYITSNDDAYAGGVVGGNGMNATITDCYNTGNIAIMFPGGAIENTYAGGIIGISQSSSVINCYNIGSIYVGDGGYAGGIAGSSTGTIQHSYFLVDTVEGNKAVGNGSAPSDESGVRSSSDLKNGGTFVNWDMDNVWKVNSSQNGGYPVLRSFLKEGTGGGSSMTVILAVVAVLLIVFLVVVFFLYGKKQGKPVTISDLPELFSFGSKDKPEPAVSEEQVTIPETEAQEEQTEPEIEDMTEEEVSEETSVEEETVEGTISEEEDVSEPEAEDPAEDDDPEQ